MADKGFSKWSLNPDDNATADELINWQEGQMPSTVNNSARAMMVRGREEHDLNQAQFKSILDTVSSKFGNKIKAITADTYTIIEAATANNWIFEFQFNDKLTLEEYNAYKAGNLYLLTTLNAPGIANNSDYQKLSYNSIIYINLIFKIGSSAYSHIMFFKLNFFGMEKINQSISFHELKNFVNCSVLQEGGNSSTNLIAIPMKKSYLGYDIINNNTLARQWYWTSPTDIFIKHSITNDMGYATNYSDMPGNQYTVISHVMHAGVIYINCRPTGDDGSCTMGKEDYKIHYYRLSFWTHNDHVLKGKWPADVVIHCKAEPQHSAAYPMVLTPTAFNPYPMEF